MAAGKHKGGRPLKHPGEPLSKAMAFRLRPRLAELLQESAAKASRTVSQEIEHRLERSFHDDRIDQAHFGTDVGAELLRIFYSLMVLEGVHPDWTGHRDRAENFRTAMNGVIAGLLDLPLELPPQEKRAEGLESAKHFLLRSSKRGDILAEIMSADWDTASAEEEPTTSKRKRG
jgi:hypothetical protein